MVILPVWEVRYLITVASGKTYAEALEHMIEVAAQDEESLPPLRTFTAV